MGIRINFSDTKAGDFKPVPAGWYLGVISDVEEKEAGPKAKHPGSAFLKVEFTLKAPAEELGGSENRKVFTNASLLRNALYTLREILEALGNEVPEDEDLEFDYEEWLNQEVALKLNVYTYNDDEERNGVKRIAKPEVYYEKSGESSLLPS